MTTASRIAFDTPTPAAPRVAAVALRPAARGDELGPRGRGVLVGSVIAAHVAGAWALLQLDAVASAVREVAPVLMVQMLAPAEPPRPAPPPPPAPPRRAAPTPAPVIAAAPAPAPAPQSFAVPPAPPEPAPPAPVQVAAPPAPPAPVAVAAPPPEPRQIAPSAVRYQKLPELHFPPLARRAGEQGTVVLRITVDASGRLKHATVHRSSGFERIDQAALHDIRSARFVPYMEDGKPVEWQTLAPLAYEL